MVEIRGSRAGTFDINGGSLYYETAGEGGPVVVLAHAGFVDRRMWDEQFPALAQHYRVLRYDRRGYGKSDPSSGSFTHRQDLLKLLKGLDIQKAHLVGCSAGGETVLDFALDHPEMASSLVLVSSGLGGYVFQGEMPKPLQDLIAALQANDLERAADLAVRIWIDGPRRAPGQVDPRIRERGREMSKTALPSAFIPDEPLQPPAVERLHEVTVPTLVILGELDDPSIAAIGDLLVSRISGAKKVVIPGAAHMPNMDNPDLFNRLVLDFLGSL